MPPVCSLLSPEAGGFPDSHSLVTHCPNRLFPFCICAAGCSCLIPPHASPNWISSYFWKAVPPPSWGHPSSQFHPPVPFSVLPDTACPADWITLLCIHSSTLPTHAHHRLPILEVTLISIRVMCFSCFRRRSVMKALLEPRHMAATASPLSRKTFAKRIWLIWKFLLDQSLMTATHLLGTYPVCKMVIWLPVLCLFFVRLDVSYRIFPVGSVNPILLYRHHKPHLNGTLPHHTWSSAWNTPVTGH